MKKLILGLLIAFSTSLTYAQSAKPMYRLSSHILDISTGLPAQNVPIKLEMMDRTTKMWKMVDEKTTDVNGRITDFLDEKKSEQGIYKLTFLVADYFKSKKTESFYPFIEVVFEIKNEKHYHVPITLSPFGYSTYRGN